jgi:hypothetical protein
MNACEHVFLAWKKRESQDPKHSHCAAFGQRFFLNQSLSNTATKRREGQEENTTEHRETVKGPNLCVIFVL